jgi:uncharacterized protein (DUF3084 family)
MQYNWESELDMSDALPRTADLRELRRDLEAGKAGDAQAILAALDAMGKAIEETRKQAQQDCDSAREAEINLEQDRDRLTEKVRELETRCGELHAEVTRLQTPAAPKRPRRRKGPPVLTLVK